MAETVAIQPVSASGPDLFFYIVATNTATLAWCLLGWLTFGVGSLIAGSVAIAAVVVSIETGIEVMGSASLLALGVHAGLELLACALATTAGLFPAVCVLLRPSSGSKGGAPVRAYFARIVSAAPLAAAAVAIVFVGALWETVVAVRLV